MTRKEVGVKLHIPERQADIRISQYESDTKKPRKDIVEGLSNILNVNEYALDNPDNSTNYGAMNMKSFKKGILQRINSLIGC